MKNVSGLGASIIIHSCKTSVEQKLLFDAGVLKKLSSLLEGSRSKRDSSLESLATILKNNPEVVLKFIESEGGRALGSIFELVKDRFPRTRLLASLCLIGIRNTSPCYLQDIAIKTILMNTVPELLGDPGQVGVEASFAFSSLIVQKEDMQKLAFEMNAIDKLYSQLQKDSLHPKHFEGILLALADMCSKLEYCRSKFLPLEKREILDYLSCVNWRLRWLPAEKSGEGEDQAEVVALVRNVEAAVAYFRSLKPNCSNTFNVASQRVRDNGLTVKLGTWSFKIFHLIVEEDNSEYMYCTTTKNVIALGQYLAISESNN